MSNPQPSPARVFRYYDLVMALFVVVLLLSNIASSAKIIDWGVNLFTLHLPTRDGMASFPLRLAFDAGTLLFPLSYIFGDVLTEVYGYRRSRRVIWAGFAGLGLSALTFWVIGRLPGEATWQQYAGQAAYQAILGGVSGGGIVIASLLAYLAGEFSNAYILARLKVRTRGRFLWVRTIGSTLVGQAIDTLAFIGIATLARVFPPELFFSLVISNYIFKVLIEALMTPFTYWVVNRLKRSEQEDYFDTHTNFNPFAM